MSRGLNLKLINSQLNAYGYKIARKGEDDSAQPTPVSQEDTKAHFPRQGERPEIRLKFAKRPAGTVGRGEFQVERILGLSDNDVKFCKNVLRTFLYLDPDIDMSQAKGNNPPGPILRVIIKAVGVLGEFKIFEKERYWPLEAFVLAILQSSSQTAKGYGARSRAKKRELEAQGITTGRPAEQTVLKIGRPRKTKPLAVAEELPSHNSNTEVTDAMLDNDVMRETATPKETLAPENGESEGKGEHTGFGDAMDISFKSLASPGGQGAAEYDNDILAYELSSMVLDPIQDNVPDEPPSSPTGPILPPDISTASFLPLNTSTPLIARSRPHLFNPTAPPRRQLSQAPAVAGDGRTPGKPEQLTTFTPPTSVSSHKLLPTTPSSPIPARTMSNKPPSAVTTANTMASTTLTLQEPSNTSPPASEALMGVTPELLAQLALLPVSTLATFPPELQAAVAVSKSSITASAPTPNPTSTSASAPAPALTKRLTMVKAPAKATPVKATDAGKVAPVTASTDPPRVDSPFDENEYLSDAPSASASNPPVGPAPKQAPVVECSSEQQRTYANATTPQSSQKETGGKVAAVDSKERPAPKPRGRKGVVKEVDLAGVNEKGGNGGEGVGTGVKRGVGRPRKSARAGTDKPVSEEPPVPQGAVGAGVDEPAMVDNQPPKRPTRNTRATTVKKGGAAN